MSSPRLWVAVLVLLVLALVSWQVAGLITAPDDGLPARDSPPPSPLAAAVESGGTAAEPQRLEVAGPDRSAPSGIDRERDLHGRVVDARGAAVRGALVEVVRQAADEHQFLDLALGSARVTVARATTDAQGAFACALPLGRPFRLEVRAAGFAPAREQDVYAGQRVEVVVHAGATFTGSVLRAGDRTPVAGALLVARALRGRAPLLRGETGPDGRFRFTDLPPGALELDVLPDADAAAYDIELELVAGAETAREILVEPGAEIRGRVVDAVTLAPIAGAEVASIWTFTKAVTTDQDGRYVFRGFSHRDLDLEARAPGYGRLEQRARDLETREVVAEVDFALQPSRRARGRVVDQSGGAIAGAYVAAAASDHDGPAGQRIDWAASRSGPGGAFEIQGLRPDIAHWLVVQHEGYGMSVFAFPAHEAETPLVELGTIALAPAATVRGVVVDEDDAPVAGQALVLRGGNTDRDRIAGAVARETWSIDGYVAERSGHTDDLGRFAFTDLAAGSYAVEAGREGKHTPVRVEVAVAAGQVAAGLRLVLPRGLAIAGRVAVSDGGAVPKVYVSVDPQDGQAAAADVEADVQGAFVARGLQPGRYALTAYPYATPADRVAGRQFVARRVADIAAGTDGVVIELPAQATVSGRVVDAAGVPVPGASVAALDEHGEHISGTTTAADGAFTLGIAAGSSATLEAHRPVAEGAPEPPRARVPAIAAGSRDVVLRLPP